MQELFDILLKVGSIGSEKIIRVLRGIMILVFSVMLYIKWVGAFSITTDPNEVLKYFMSEKFLYSVLIYCFVNFCEVIAILLLAKINEMVLIGKVLKVVNEFKYDRDKYTEEDKVEIRNQIDEGTSTVLGGGLKWLGVEYEHNLLKREIQDNFKNIDPESMERTGLFAIEVYVYSLCTSHSLWWGLLLLIFLSILMCVKAVLIFLKAVSPLFVNRKPKNRINPPAPAN